MDRALIKEPFDLVVTCGGGYPLDKTFYQTGKGMVTAVPACHKGTVVLIVAECEEGVGSESFTELMTGWSGKWREFLSHIAGTPVKKDQWQVQMLTRVMEAVGTERVLLVCEGLKAEIVSKLWVTPVNGQGTPAQRAQRVINDYIAKHPTASIAIIPKGRIPCCSTPPPGNPRHAANCALYATAGADGRCRGIPLCLHRGFPIPKRSPRPRSLLGRPQNKRVIYLL